MSFVDDFFDNAWSSYLKKEDGKNWGYKLSDKVKEYPNMLQIVVYHESYDVIRGRKSVRRAKKASEALDKTHRSARRSKKAIYDIITCNDWDFWCTFTFDPKKVDRYDFNRVGSKMSLWLGRQKGLKYIVVPEYHKDGAIHFHALIKNYTGRLMKTKHRTKNGQHIYKGNFGSGYHQLVELDKNKDAIAKYMIKQYITKSGPLLFNRKRYWCSKGLDRPITFINSLTKYNLWSLVKNKKPSFINQSYEIHNIPKTNIDYFNYNEQLTMIL